MLASLAGQRVIGEAALQNQGNTKISLQPVLVGNNSLGNIKVSLDGIIFTEPDQLTIVLLPGESKKAYVAVEIPRNVKAGTYKTRLRFREVV